MVGKVCPRCRGASFSSSTRDRHWRCPYCGRNLGHTPDLAPEAARALSLAWRQGRVIPLRPEYAPFVPAPG